MKKIIFTSLLTVAVIASGFSRDSIKVNFAITNNFKEAFEQAENIRWTVKNDFTKASFNLNGVEMEAFYDYNGEMIGTSKNVSLDQLPINAKRTFAKKYSGYTVKEAIRFEGKDEDAWYISAENEKQSVVFKVSDNSLVSIFKLAKRK